MLVDLGGAAGNTMGSWTQDVTYCGGYSYTHSGTQCQLLQGADDHTATAGASSDYCGKMTNASAFSAKQAAIKAAWTTFSDSGNNTAQTSMVSVAESQAGHEKAYLEAWYAEDLWTKITAKLNPEGADAYATGIKAAKDALEVNDDSVDTNTNGAEALSLAADTAL